MTVVLGEDELRRCAGFDLPALDAVERAFVALAAGDVSMLPVMHVAVSDPPGDIDVKGAFIPCHDVVAIKIASGFFGNNALGMPSSSAMMAVLSARTGRCEAVLLDNGYLTDLRTGLAGAVAARHLAPPGQLRVGVIGAGVQARFQVEALTIERRVASISVFARRTESAEAYATDISDRLGVPVTIEASIEAVARGCDLLITTTPSRNPLIQAGWLKPGLHVTAVGSDLPGKRELDLATLRRADRLFADHPPQNRLIGELQAFANDAPELRSVVSLGDVIRGVAPGRENSRQVTICDLSGVGVQDTAIAAHALVHARMLGVGTKFD